MSTEIHQDPMQIYRDMVAAGTFVDDSAQRLVMEKLGLLSRRLRDYQPKSRQSFARALFGWGRESVKMEQLQGLYIYGGVGTGKSTLMDLFYETLTLPKMRVHFHAFMRDIHDTLFLLRKEDQTEPLLKIAEGISEKALVICFDEMQISDITDAMLVGRLFEALYARGIVTVITSNHHPRDLYKDGLNRHLFLPFIDVISTQNEVVSLDHGEDYRRQKLHGQQTYFAPDDATAKKAVDEIWSQLAGGVGAPFQIAYKGREIGFSCYRNKIARVPFDELCGRPLGASDYLALSQYLDTLILEHVPVMAKKDSSQAARFIALVDVLYETKKRVVMTAGDVPEALHVEGTRAFEFERTVSRLHEMQGADWPPEPGENASK